MRMKTLAFALLATSALVGLSAIDLDAQRTARTELQRIIASHPGLTVGGIDASPFLGRVVLTRVEAVSGATRVSIGTLRLPLAGPDLGLIGSAAASPFDDEPSKPEAAPEPAPAPAPPAAPPATPAPAVPPMVAAPAGSGSASAENVVITNGTTTYHIKRIDLGGTSLTNADLAAILDAKSTDKIADRLKRITAASVVIPEITADDVTPEREVHWTERQILLANVVAGRVAAGSAAGMSIATKDQKSVVNGTLGAVEATGLDIAQLVRVFTTQRTDDSEPLVPLMDSVTINGATFTNVTDKSTTSVGPIKEAGFKGRPLKEDMSNASGSDPEKTKQLTNDFFRSFSLASFEASDIKYHGDEKKDAFSLASLSMTNFGDNKIGGLSATAFVFTGAGTNLAIGGMTVRAFDIPAAGQTKDPKDTNLPVLGRTDLTDIKFDVDTPATDPGTSATHVKFDLKHIGFAAEQSAPNEPNHGSMAIEKLTFDVPPDGSAAALREMGYTSVDASSGMETLYDKPAQTLAIKDFNISGVDMGVVRLGLDLTNVSPALFSTNQDASKVAALAVLIKSFDFKLENAGLIDKALAWRAKADNMTPAQEQAQLAEVAAAQIPAMLGPGPNAKAITDAVTKFINAPKSLHISASSKTGLGIADMALISTPDVLLDSLEVKASANE